MSVNIEKQSDDQPRNLVTWQDAELLAAGHMRTLGFTDADLTESGADGGIDVQSRHAAAQVKFHATPTGAPEIQKLRGAAYDFDHQIFYSAGGYTPAAIAFAERAEVALFIIGPWSSIAAANAAAEKLLGGEIEREGGSGTPLPPMLLTLGLR
ncbi:restriction endonuclease [Leifsonia sp. P73]|uniref:restriction endonuclease n=1 Tax=Leifsonia sp. P73 TaxID=3423959 RepID=UPI003DA41615